MIEKIITLKSRLENLKNETEDKEDKAAILKIIVMLNLSELVILANTKFSKDEAKEYLMGQAFIGHYFIDWGKEWVSDGYTEIVKYLHENGYVDYS